MTFFFEGVSKLCDVILVGEIQQKMTSFKDSLLLITDWTVIKWHYELNQ